MSTPLFPKITDEEFRRFQTLIEDLSGIYLPPTKKVMLSGRLTKRLRHYQLKRFGDYFRLITEPGQAEELQTMLNLVTTNETHFFREPAHFDYLKNQILPSVKVDNLRLWSAACSTGEEPYTLAMILADHRQQPWEILGTDLNHQVLHTATDGLYPLFKAEEIPAAYRRRHCLKGVRSQQGQFLIGAHLRNRVRFMAMNLTHSYSGLGRFHVIFLRNVMIYFDQDTKKDIVDRVTEVLHPGGHLFISHTESLHGIRTGLRMLKPSIYRKP